MKKRTVAGALVALGLLAGAAYYIFFAYQVPPETFSDWEETVAAGLEKGKATDRPVLVKLGAPT